MNLEALKRLAAQRTKGEWKHELERYSAKNVIARAKLEPWIAVAQPENNGDVNAEWIAAINNSADKLLAVVEAAEAVCLDWDFEGGGVTNGLHIELNEALAALEEG